MITRMEIIYRSKEPCSTKPKIFTTGGYEVNKDGHSFHFDFEEMEAGTRFENGYLYIDSLQKNLDYDYTQEPDPKTLDFLLRNLDEKDLVDIFYECFADSEETQFIELIPEAITFYDLLEGGFLAIEVFDKQKQSQKRMHGFEMEQDVLVIVPGRLKKERDGLHHDNPHYWVDSSNPKNMVSRLGEIIGMSHEMHCGEDGSIKESRLILVRFYSWYGRESLWIDPKMVTAIPGRAEDMLKYYRTYGEKIAGHTVMAGDMPIEYPCSDDDTYLEIEKLKLQGYELQAFKHVYEDAKEMDGCSPSFPDISMERLKEIIDLWEFVDMK